MGCASTSSGRTRFRNTPRSCDSHTSCTSLRHRRDSRERGIRLVRRVVVEIGGRLVANVHGRRTARGIRMELNAHRPDPISPIGEVRVLPHLPCGHVDLVGESVVLGVARPGVGAGITHRHAILAFGGRRGGHQALFLLEHHHEHLRVDPARLRDLHDDAGSRLGGGALVSGAVAGSGRQPGRGRGAQVLQAGPPVGADAVRHLRVQEVLDSGLVHSGAVEEHAVRDDLGRIEVRSGDRRGAVDDGCSLRRDDRQRRREQRQHGQDDEVTPGSARSSGSPVNAASDSSHRNPMRAPLSDP